MYDSNLWHTDIQEKKYKDHNIENTNIVSKMNKTCMTIKALPHYLKREQEL